MTTKNKRKKVSVSDFKTHCTEYLKAVESGNQEIEITRHGKIIAVAMAPAEADNAFILLGAGKETAIINESYDAHAPAFDNDEWEMNQ